MLPGITKTDMNKGYLILIGCGILSGTCNQHGGKAAAADSAKVKNDTVTIPADTVIRYSSYAGILPCANCPGILTTVNLMRDHSYQKLTTHLPKKGKKRGDTIDETGYWVLRGKDTIFLKDIKDAPALYLKTDSFLVQLDASGRRISGDLASRYILRRTKH